MRIAAPKIIRQEDVKPEDRDIAQRIGVSINTFNEAVYNVLNGNIEVDNTNQQIISVLTKTDGSGVPTNPIQFKATTQGGAFKFLMVGQVDNLTNPSSYPSSQPYAAYSRVNSLVTVNYISSLPINSQLRITFWLIN